MNLFRSVVLCLALGGALWGNEGISFSLPPRLIKIDPASSLTIPQQADNLEIVIAEKALPITRFAAQELKKHLQIALNTTIPITTRLTPQKISFVLGDNSYARAAGVTGKTAYRDSFYILRQGKKIYIIGHDAPIVGAFHGAHKGYPESVESSLKRGGWRQFNARGTLFGVYDFLERFVGVRFYFPNKLGVVIPKGRNLTLPNVEIFDRPDCILREFGGIYKGQWEDEPNRGDKDIFYGYYITPQRNLANYRNRGNTFKIPCMHGLQRLELERRFGSQHPEYFALRSDGQRYNKSYMRFMPQFCYSNAGFKNEIYLDAKAALLGQTSSSRGMKSRVWNPISVQDGFFNLSLPDAHQPCTCKQCRAVYQGNNLNKISNHLWNFVIDIAQKLKQEKVPGLVTMAAYSVTTPLPERALPDNVLVELSVNGPYSVKFPCEGAINRINQLEMIKMWRRKVTNNTLLLYNYAAKYEASRIRCVPNLAPLAYGKFYSEAGPYINGAFIEASTDDYLFNYLNYYIFGKMMWDTKCDYRAILQDHHRCMFGPAAATMGALYEEMEHIWIDKIAGRFSQNNLGPVPICPSEYEVWTQIYTPEKLADFKRRYDLAEKQAALDTEALARIRYIRAHYFEPMLKYSQQYLAAASQVDFFGADLKPLPAQSRIVIDGKLNESFWKQATILKLQPKQRNVAKTTLETLVYLTEDEKNLYVAFKCFENDSTLYDRAPRRQFDDHAIWRDNEVEIFLNPRGDRQHYFQWMINSSGAVSDLACVKQGANFVGNWQWNSNAEIKVGRFEQGWCVEAAIPKRALPGIESGNFCANFTRERPAGNSAITSTWSPFLSRGSHDPEKFGTIWRNRQVNNLIKNMDFPPAPIKKYANYHAGPWSWSPKLPGVKVEFDKQCFVTGTQSLKLTMTKPVVVSVSQSVETLKPNTRYRLTFYVKLDKVKPKQGMNGVKAWLWTGKENIWLPKNGQTGTLDWYRQSFEFQTPATLIPERTNLRLGAIKVTGTVWFDCIGLEELPD